MAQELKFYICKTLSRNDTGETHSHQSGISIPKFAANTDVFPHLGIETLNPRVSVQFIDENGEPWDFEYIYYNDLYHGKEKKKAHDEFRLTCVRKYLNKVNAKAGDIICFGIDKQNFKTISLIKKHIADQIIVTETKSDHLVVNKSLFEFDDLVADDIPILDPNDEAEPTIIKINKDWMKVEYNK